ncbi:hypothetical protein CERSUDRAFT_110478 [Gelatoporia subvermispora B]|uniref:Hemimethylated DNA-binding domain-containing protein n=1 Tax=Ceriporiopsis subvermispora (strain B) TaxID=914234 RepID=M2RBW3_CERS8|nr:hypothetical protein CERSUDRAFT_110478 [Gelatoporia subvermispora B]
MHEVGASTSTGSGSTWPWLPVELYVHILTSLPPSDAGLTTLVSCLSANSVLRSAALTSSLWEPFYRARYTECVEEREAELRATYGGDWRLLFRARRRVDRAALRELDETAAELAGRHRKASRFAKEYSFDVWNALEREAHLPPPRIFRRDTQGGPNDDSDGENDISHALPRRYWARVMLGVIARRYAIEKLVRVCAGDESIDFEETLACLSAFYDESPKRILRQLDDLATLCRTYLAQWNTELDSNGNEFDLRVICTRVRDFLRNHGFTPAEGLDFHDPLNQFPHAFLNDHRRSIPMSLVYVFTGICRRLGIDAAPVNYPERVLAHVTAPGPHGATLLFDVFNGRSPVDRASVAGGGTVSDFLLPCAPVVMLQRAANNIINFVQFQRVHRSASLTEANLWADYAACTCFLLRTQEAHLATHITQFKPYDGIAVLCDVLAPVLNANARRVLEEQAGDIEKQDEQRAQTKYRRSEHKVAHFVGLVFKHARYGYTGCITGWEPKCAASVEWQAQMEVFKLPRGAKQPFYTVIAMDGHKRYVAEENIIPIVLTKDIAQTLFESRSSFSRFFEGAELGGAVGRGRLLLSAELRSVYPEDDAAGAAWAAEGDPSVSTSCRAQVLTY